MARKMISFKEISAFPWSARGKTLFSRGVAIGCAYGMEARKNLEVISKIPTILGTLVVLRNKLDSIENDSREVRMTDNLLSSLLKENYKNADSKSESGV